MVFIQKFTVFYCVFIINYHTAHLTDDGGFIFEPIGQWKSFANVESGILLMAPFTRNSLGACALDFIVSFI